MDCNDAANTPSTSDRPAIPDEAEMSPVAGLKADCILNSCGEKPDIAALVHFATSTDGLVNDEVRRKVCTFAKERATSTRVLITPFRALIAGLHAL